MTLRQSTSELAPATGRLSPLDEDQSRSAPSQLVVAGPSLQSSHAGPVPVASLPRSFEVWNGTSGPDGHPGTSGNDSIKGGAGDDSLFGLAGNDAIEGESGDDFLRGDDGGGQTSPSPNPGDDTLFGGAGNDKIFGDGGADFIDGGDGSDELFGDNTDSNTVTSNLYRFEGNDTIFGGTGADLIRGNGGDDQIDGGADNDFLAGGAGRDTIRGGDGDDRIYAFDQSDTTDADSDFGELWGEAGNDRVWGGAATDRLDGGDGNDDLAGYAKNDSLDGGAGNDILDGGSGSDTLTGGAGADQFEFPSGSRDDIPDVDVITDWGDGADSISGQMGRNDHLRVTMVAPQPFSATSIARSADWGTVEVVGSTGNDSITGGVNDDTLDGGAGDDTLVGGAGDDRMTGGAGNDQFHLNGSSTAAETDTLADWGNGNDGFGGTTLGLGDQLIVTMAGAQFTAAVIAALHGQVKVTGSQGNDTINGGLNADTLDGSSGNDQLNGAGGNDSLVGGAGLDTAQYERASTDYTIGAGGASVQARAGSEGLDTLSGVERLRFADVALAFDLNGNAGTVARCVGAVFGSAAVARADYAGIGLSLLDGGMSASALMALALETALGPGYTPAAEVQLLFTNLVGRAPDAGELGYFAGTLERGEFTAISLALMAADLDLNAQNIDLVGLGANGLAYLPGT